MEVTLTLEEVSMLQDFLQAHVDTFECTTEDEDNNMELAKSVLAKLPYAVK